MRYFDTSAKDNIGVTEAFLRITTDVLERLSSNGGAVTTDKAGSSKIQVIISWSVSFVTTLFSLQNSRSIVWPIHVPLSKLCCSYFMLG